MFLVATCDLTTVTLTVSCECSKWWLHAERPNRCLQHLDKICAVSSLRVIGYVRCSSQEQATEGMSLETQASRIRAWCELHDAELAELVEDGGVSGGRALADRPGGSGLASLLKDRNPWIEAIVVVRLDRLAATPPRPWRC